jgi:hypothetical protein
LAGANSDAVVAVSFSGGRMLCSGSSAELPPVAPEASPSGRAPAVSADGTLPDDVVVVAVSAFSIGADRPPGVFTPKADAPAAADCSSG